LAVNISYVPFSLAVIVTGARLAVNISYVPFSLAQY
jgi:hypothetical protein